MQSEDVGIIIRGWRGVPSSPSDSSFRFIFPPLVKTLEPADDLALAPSQCLHEILGGRVDDNRLRVEAGGREWVPARDRGASALKNFEINLVTEGSDRLLRPVGHGDFDDLERNGHETGFPGRIGVKLSVKYNAFAVCKNESKPPPDPGPFSGRFGQIARPGQRAGPGPGRPGQRNRPGAIPGFSMTD